MKEKSEGRASDHTSDEASRDSAFLNEKSCYYDAFFFLLSESFLNLRVRTMKLEPEPECLYW